jgi:glutamyl-tRNA synthetase
MNATVVTRFAPSPTGQIHLGNVRTALFAWAWARHHQGEFILRVEDTDLERSSDAHIADLQQDLQWLGLSIDLGPGSTDPRGPFRQTQRTRLYDEAIGQLKAAHRIYPCFCTEVELEMERRQARAAKLPPRYSGRCASLSEAERADRLAKGMPHTLRFKLNPHEIISYTDAVRGEQKFSTDELGDFVISRSDGSVGFLFSNAVDDARMGITHVLRGEDHVSNTPRQIAIMNALGAQTPVYAHLPLLVGENGAPLSKRDGSASVRHFREMGYLPGALINLLFRLGHHCSEARYLQMTEIAELFSLDALGRAPARFDEQQLKHWQREAIQAAPIEAILPWFDRGQDRDQWKLQARLLKANTWLPSDAAVWMDLVQQGPSEYSAEAQAVFKSTGSAFFEHLLQALNELNPADSATWLKQVRVASGLSGPQFFKPLRLALTNRLDGPDLATWLQLMDRAVLAKALSSARALA